MPQSLSPELLRAFVLVHQTGSFHAAAETGNLATSTVGHRVQRLEEVVGNRVFDRRSGGRRVRLTVFGHVLLPIAEDLLRRHDSALNTLRAHVPATRLKVGATEDHAGYLMPAVIKRFHQSFPDVEVDIETGMTVDMRHDVAERFDLVLAAQEDGDGGGHVIAREPLAWVCHESSKPARSLRLAVYPKGCLYRSWAEHRLQGEGRRTAIALSSFSRSAIENALKSSDTVSVFPRSTIKAPFRELTAREGFPDLPSLELAIYTRRQPEKAVRWLAEAIVGEIAATH